jgi:lysophospholipase L1-like esterase
MFPKLVLRLYWPVYWHVAAFRRRFWHVGRLYRRAHGHGPVLVAMGDSLTEPFTGLVFPSQIWVRRLGRQGYKTVNLAVGGQTTTDMCRRVEEFLSGGQPEIAVLFAGVCDIEFGVDPIDTERNVTFIIEWLRAHGVRKIALIGPGIINLKEVPYYLRYIPDWSSSADTVRTTLRDVAARHDAVYVDLRQFLCERIACGKDPDFSSVPYRQSRSWHASPRDGHFNAYGHRLVAEAFLTATAGWRPAQPRRRSLPLIGRRRTGADLRAT